MLFRSLNDDTEDFTSMIDSEILSQELIISVPMLNDTELKILLNEDIEISSDDSSVEDDEQPSLKRDQQRLQLLNDPNYAIILDFWQKFSSAMSIKNYPISRFELDLLTERPKVSGRFVDIHLSLLKKISCGKTFQPEEFDAAITRFAYRFDQDDGEQLENKGYIQTSIETKVRILKNLMEKQFERNTAFRNFLTNKVDFQLHPQPFGRDRFGAFYWLFMDNKCFFRLFREDMDKDRSWMNVAKNRDELENLIKILITDHIVRRKFPEWKISYESFSRLPISTDFEERFTPNLVDVEEQVSPTQKSVATSESSVSSIDLHPGRIKPKTIDLHPHVNMERQLQATSPLSNPTADPHKHERSINDDSDQESMMSSIINPNRADSASSSSDQEDRNSVDFHDENSYLYSNEAMLTSKVLTKTLHTDFNSRTAQTQVNACAPSTAIGVKRKLVDYEDTESDSDEDSKPMASVQKDSSKSVRKRSKSNSDLPIALRRPRRTGGTCNTASISSLSNCSVSRRKKANSKKSSDKSSTSSNEESPVNERFQHKTRKNYSRSRSAVKRFSSDSSETQHASDDDDDLFLGSDKPMDNIDLLIAQEQEEQQQEDHDNEQIPTAKTLAKLLENISKKSPSKTELVETKCRRCAKNNHPEILLICETCHDGYHTYCVRPVLISVPDYEWHCGLCQHKLLCDNLMMKLQKLIRDHNYLETVRRLDAYKRVKRTPKNFIPAPAALLGFKRCPTPVTISAVTPPRAPTPISEPIAGKKSEPKIVQRRRVQMILSSSEDDEPPVKPAPAPVIKKEPSQIPTVMSKEDPPPSTPETHKDPPPAKPVETSLSNHNELQSEIRSSESKVPDGTAENSLSAEESDKRQLRQRQTKDYRYDEFDSKIKEAIIECGIEKNQSDTDSDATEIMSESEKLAIKCIHDEFDNDFDGSDGRNDDDDFVPYRSRSMDEDSRNEAKENAQQNPAISAEKSGKAAPKKRQRRSSTSNSKRKTNPKPNNRSNRRKPKGKTDDDMSILSETNLSNLSTADNIASQTTNGLTKSDNDTKKTEKEKPKRQRRMTTTTTAKKKKAGIQQENISDEDLGPPPTSSRIPHRKRSGSDDTFLGDDDDYEKLIQKRRLFHHGKIPERRSILDHIKKLVGDEEENENEDDNDNGDDENTNDKSEPGDLMAPEETESKSQPKRKNIPIEYEEEIISDEDDDFPDGEEMLKAVGVTDLKKSLATPKASVFRAQFMAPMQSYQYAMIDPTAHVDFLLPPEPSEQNGINGETATPTANENT